MMRRISMAARDELVAALAGRYARGDRGERGRILDEFAAVTGLSPQACDATVAGRAGDSAWRTAARPPDLRCGCARGADRDLGGIRPPVSDKSPFEEGFEGIELLP